MPCPGIYAIGDDQGHMFVAKTEEDVELRVSQYLTGEKKNRFLKGSLIQRLELLCPDEKNDLEDWLRCEVLSRMYKYGIQNVRGWMFYQEEATLCSFQIRSAFNQVCYRFRLCNQCGGEGHSDASCISNTYATWATCMNDLNQKDSSTST